MRFERAAMQKVIKENAETLPSGTYFVNACWDSIVSPPAKRQPTSRKNAPAVNFPVLFLESRIRRKADTKNSASPTHCTALTGLPKNTPAIIGMRIPAVENIDDTLTVPVFRHIIPQ